jgi:hypothetical protein
MNKLFDELNSELLAADCVWRNTRIKMVKTAYSEEENKIMKSNMSSTGTNYLYNKPKLVRSDILRPFLRIPCHLRLTAS